jgi:hypothetical protein
MRFRKGEEDLPRDGRGRKAGGGELWKYYIARTGEKLNRQDAKNAKES